MYSGNDTTSPRSRLRADLCENLRRFVVVRDEGLFVELFDGFSFPIDATADQVAYRLLELATAGACVASRTAEENATFLAVAVPQGDEYCMVFDKETRQIVTVVDLSPKALKRRRAAAN